MPKAKNLNPVVADELEIMPAPEAGAEAGEFLADENSALNTALESANTALAQRVAELEAENTALRAAPDVVAASGRIVEFDGRNVRIVHAIQLVDDSGNLMHCSIEDIANNSNLIARLLYQKSTAVEIVAD